jgi:outer membrane protein assembly factor BamE (lipoprotein component of BamABCDE complex)
MAANRLTLASLLLGSLPTRLPALLPTRLPALLVAFAALGLACASDPPPQEPADRLTVGKVQGEIKVGMDAASVAQILGSPNIVTTDEKRREVWIYDKISSESVQEKSSFGGTIIILGGSTSSKKQSKTQRTLTIIIKFDEEKKVRDFAYNASQF